MRFLSSASLVLLLNLCLADAKPLASAVIKPTASALDDPGLIFLTSVNSTTGAIYDFGTGPYGKRVITAITGGTATGPKLNGTAVFTLLPLLCRSGDVVLGFAIDASVYQFNEEICN